ncbi:MAG: hypothetical protein E7066_09695 [Lentimicrobiaceae bacterium]|nr:hypothetical protein [Lentimicrobiaceae bacterium]
MEETIKLILPYIKGLSWSVIIAGTAYILYNRTRVKVVSLNDITTWANQNKGVGTNMFVSKLSVMPNEVRKQVQYEIGFKRVLNGYKDETSIFVTILDDTNNIISSSYFLGTRLDEELKIALGNKTGINIKLM